jgi:hypothetical protein
MSLSDALGTLYPNASPVTDYNVVDRGDGRGQQLTLWDDAKLGPRPTQQQIDAAPPPPSALDQLYDQTLKTQRVLKALVLALNDGSLSVGSNLTSAQLRAAIKAKM